MRLDFQNVITLALAAPAKMKKITQPRTKTPDAPNACTQGQKLRNEPRKLLKTHKSNPSEVCLGKNVSRTPAPVKAA
jgi:hypothetical protein